MKFITRLMNRLCCELEWFCQQRPDHMHQQVHMAFSNASLKGVGFLKIDYRGKVTSVSPEELIIIPSKEEKINEANKAFDH